MARTILPSQLGYTAPSSSYGSRVYIGRDVSVSFEAAGLGEGGRPDGIDALRIHIGQGDTQGIIYLDITDVNQIIAASQIKGNLFLKLREVSVCQVNDATGDSEEKKMVVLASEPY
jgi:hypothetical protein